MNKSRILCQLIKGAFQMNTEEEVAEEVGQAEEVGSSLEI